jgi:hypothetical protein
MNTCAKCKPVAFKHEDGWDIYPKSECQNINGKWIPKFFDCAIVEDAKTKKEAFDEWRKSHLFGICLVVA